MNKIFKPYLDKFVIVFIDNILIYSRSENDLRILLELLRNEKLYVKFFKGELLLNEVQFFWPHCKLKCRVDLVKIESISEWEIPKSLTEARSSLSLAGCYRRFIKDFSHIAIP